MKSAWFFVAFVVLFPASDSAEAVSHRLIAEHFLDMGNRWVYRTHITRWPDARSVDWSGTVTYEVKRREKTAGYETVRVDTTFTCPQAGNDWAKVNYYLTPDYLMKVREENADGIYVATNKDPFEELPVWVDESDNERYVGHGKRSCRLKEITYFWNGYQDSYITFLRRERITVPAGTFNCVVVLLRTEFLEFDGICGYQENTVWFNAAVGDIKVINYFWMWDPSERKAVKRESTDELSWTNVTYPQDFDSDFDVDTADLDTFISAWLTKSGAAGWNRNCDLNADNQINMFDFAIFGKYWLANVE
jgi:hypothetical protein